MSGESRVSTFNLITVIFLLLTVICIVMTVVFALGVMQVPFLAPRPPVIPQVAALPTPTITNTPVPPTWTLTPTWTFTPSSTPSITATITASLTITPTPGPTDTPTITSTPQPTGTATVTPTLTATITPTGPTATTASPWPFQIRGETHLPVFAANSYNAAGCAWQGIGGQVLDMNNQPVLGMQIRVTNSQGTAYPVVTSNSNTLYGAGGWEVSVSTQTNNETYLVDLLTPEGTQAAQTVTVTFPNNCAQNLALLVFERIR